MSHNYVVVSKEYMEKLASNDKNQAAPPITLGALKEDPSKPTLFWSSKNLEEICHRLNNDPKYQGCAIANDRFEIQWDLLDENNKWQSSISKQTDEKVEEPIVQAEVSEVKKRYSIQVKIVSFFPDGCMTQEALNQANEFLEIMGPNVLEVQPIVDSRGVIQQVFIKYNKYS
jgi:hypothetical protein